MDTGDISPDGELEMKYRNLIVLAIGVFRGDLFFNAQFFHAGI